MISIWKSWLKSNWGCRSRNSISGGSSRLNKVKYGVSKFRASSWIQKFLQPGRAHLSFEIVLVYLLAYLLCGHCPWTPGCAPSVAKHAVEVMLRSLAMPTLFLNSLVLWHISVGTWVTSPNWGSISCLLEGGDKVHACIHSSVFPLSSVKARFHSVLRKNSGHHDISCET